MEDRTLRLEFEQALAQWQCLKSQLNPHFLFNNLSILSSLVHTDPGLSEKFIDQLSRTYRYILEKQDQDLVPLRNELEFISAFGFLLRTRFSDKFELRVNVPEQARDEFLMIPLALQPLIENAIRFNRMSQKDPLLVDIGLEGEWLVVKNGLRLRMVPGGHHGGSLHHLMDRYRLVTDRPIEAGEKEDFFIVRIPLLQAQH